MTNRTKRIWYRVFSAICILAAIFGLVICCCSALPFVFKKEEAARDYSYVWAFGFFIGVLLLLPLNTLVHELGHLLFGKLVGLRFSSMRISHFFLAKTGNRYSLRFIRVNDVAGASQMYPSNEKHIRGKMIFYSLGGPFFSLVYGAAALVCFILMPMHPVLYFFALFAPLALLEAALSLYPAEIATGKTDGGVIVGLMKNLPSAVVALRVMTAQGILTKGTFAEIGEDFLFLTPVVREDDVAFLALLQLRFDYLFYAGREEEALNALFRLEELLDYLNEQQRADVACDLLYAYSVLSPDLNRAESVYFPMATGARETSSYLRAVAAYTAARGEKGAEGLMKRAREAAQSEAMEGVKALEHKFLDRIASAQ